MASGSSNITSKRSRPLCASRISTPPCSPLRDLDSVGCGALADRGEGRSNALDQNRP
jgi:hypothetical protein